MEIFGLGLQEFIFSIFLPFLFFFLLVYALLRKSKILGEGERINSLIALTLSALSIFSLYSLRLTASFPFLAAIVVVVAFASLFFYGILSYAMKKQVSYSTGEAFKTEDEKKFDAGVKNCENIWARFVAEKDPAAKQKIFAEMDAEVRKLEPIAQKLGKSLYEFNWYKEYKETITRAGER